MKHISTIKQIINNPKRLLEIALNRSCNILPEWIYLSLKYRMIMGKWPDVRHPKTFTEKLQWLKIHDHNPEYTKMVDKYAVKDWVAGIIGDQYIIPTLGCWDSPEEIEWDKLPQKFVLKITHGGGGNGVILCRDKDSLDKDETVKSLQQEIGRAHV